MALPIDIPKEALAAFCRQHQVRRLSLFGSVLRPDFGPASDVDVLVEFEPGHRIGLLGLAAMQRELTGLVGREVDLRTPGDLSPYFRDDVLKSALLQYAA
jgi:predicted nucleotidyltransferase